MTNIYKGFLFGHYDSRGGATFIECNDEMTARLLYIEMGQGYEQTMKDAAEWSSPESIAEWEAKYGTPPHDSWQELHALRDDKEAAIRWMTEEDFIDSMTLESYREIRDGEDIEYGSDGEPNTEAQLAAAFEDGLSWAEDKVKEQTPNPFQELLWWHETTKRLKLTPKGEHPGGSYSSPYEFPRKDPEPGWKRSEFGEDACGVIFCAAGSRSE